MKRTITIDPLTRIEGHARVEVDIDEHDQITRTVFKVMDFRGWEAFTCGTQVEMMPLIMPRVCGTCSVSHHLASVKAVDNLFNVTPPRTAILLREALNLAGYIHSHGIHIFALAGPDLLVEDGLKADPGKRNIVYLSEIAPEVAKKALELRAISTKITEVIGGRGIHPVSAVVGGMAVSLSEANRDFLKREANRGLILAKELMAVFKKKVLDSQTELLYSLDLPTDYLSLTQQGCLNFYQGNIRVRKLDGTNFEFPEEQWQEYLSEKVDPYSYAKFVFCKDIPYRVGPLARLNCCDNIDTPLAQAELEEFRDKNGFPCHQTVLYHYARLIELLHATEKLVTIFEDNELCSKNVRTLPTQKPPAGGEGTGIVEAPRGTLIHHYQVDENAIVTSVNLIVATQQNIKAINDTVDMSVKKYLNQADEELLLNGIEFGVRCYDPCLSCATHRIGEMKLEVIVRRGPETIRICRK
jgi:F420-non-reducing hydrogenase large subunit